MRLKRRLEGLEARAAARQRGATVATVRDVWADIERLADWLHRLGSGEVSVEDAPPDVQETWRDMQRGATTGDLKGQADHCGRPIRGRRPQALYCSDQCRLDAQIERRRQRIEQQRGKDRRFWRDGRWSLCCLRCNKSFWTRRLDAQYCSPACRQATYRDPIVKAIHEHLFGPGSWEADHARRK
jgi:hypothetical protein